MNDRDDMFPIEPPEKDEASSSQTGKAAQLNPDNVPVELKRFLPIVEKWGGIDDDVLAKSLKKVSVAELLELSNIVEEMNSEILGAWLSGPMATDPYSMTQEYVAFTRVIIAAELAEIILKDRKND